MQNHSLCIDRDQEKLFRKQRFVSFETISVLKESGNFNTSLLKSFLTNQGPTFAHLLKMYFRT